MSVRAARPVALNSFAPGNDRSDPDNQISSPMELTKEPHPECDPDPHISLSDLVPWTVSSCLNLVPWIVSSCLNLVPEMRAQKKKKKRDCDDRAKKKKKKDPSIPQIGSWLIGLLSSLPPTTPAARLLLAPTPTQHQQLGTPRGRPTHPCPSPCRDGRSGPGRCKVRTRATRLVLIDTARRLSG